MSHAFNVHKSKIHRLLQRLTQSGSVSDRRRSGRPRITSATEDRRIRTTHLKDRSWFTTACETSRQLNGRNNVSRNTVGRRLNAFGIQSRIPAKKAFDKTCGRKTGFCSPVYKMDAAKLDPHRASRWQKKMLTQER